MKRSPKPEDPSSNWTNFTDGSCQRLIHVGNNVQQARYYLGCYAVGCCEGEQSGNHLELQIPNVHFFDLPWPVEQGKENITTEFGNQVETDTWTWSFTLQTW